MSRYIDADKVVELLVEFSTLAIYEECSKQLLDAADYFKKRAPTADVEEVRHGKWIFFRGYITCSSCKAQPYREHRHIDYDNLYKRCPECGAKMCKEKEE